MDIQGVRDLVQEYEAKLASLDGWLEGEMAKLMAAGRTRRSAAATVHASAAAPSGASAPKAAKAAKAAAAPKAPKAAEAPKAAKTGEQRHTRPRRDAAAEVETLLNTSADGMSAADIRAALYPNDGLAEAEVSKALNAQRVQVSSILQTMQEEGKVIKAGKLYALTPALEPVVLQDQETPEEAPEETPAEAPAAEEQEAAEES